MSTLPDPMVGIFIFALLIVIAVAARGIRRRERGLKILDETLLGLVAMLTSLPYFVPQLRIPAGIGISVLLVRFLWATFRRARGRDDSRPT
jgi:hypothetical protein